MSYLLYEGIITNDFFILNNKNNLYINLIKLWIIIKKICQILNGKK